jgi:hypothetical protein
MNDDLQSRLVRFIGIEGEEVILQIKGMGDEGAYVSFSAFHILDRARKAIHLTTDANICLVVKVQII